MASLVHRQGGTLPETGAVSVLVCRLDRRLAALSVRDVGETMRPLPVTPMAGAPPSVRGVAIIRGDAVPVLDVGILLGGQPLEAANRFVTMRMSGRWVALAVDEVMGVHSLSPSALGQLPPLLQRTEAVDALGVLDAEVIVLLRAARLVPETVWMALGGGLR